MDAHISITGVGAEFLASTDVVDWYHADVRTLACCLAAGHVDPVEIARRCFEWVRDEIRQSVDHGDTRVTCAASDVLSHRTGFCYAKSHLLAALLRANGIPAGFCYQRLAVGDIGPPYCLHGLNAVWLPEIGWYRVDARGNGPRGNKLGVHARFAPPHEHLAFAATGPGEATFAEVWADPLPVVLDALHRHASVADVCANLPDLEHAEIERFSTTRVSR